MDTIVNRANGRRPRLPPLRFPSSFFLLIHPSRNIPVNPVACHGSFEFSHRKPPKSDREERCLYWQLALSQEIATADRNTNSNQIINHRRTIGSAIVAPFAFLGGYGRTRRTLPRRLSPPLAFPDRKKTDSEMKNNKGVCKNNLPLNPLIVAPDL